MIQGGGRKDSIDVSRVSAEGIWQPLHFGESTGLNILNIAVLHQESSFHSISIDDVDKLVAGGEICSGLLVHVWRNNGAVNGRSNFVPLSLFFAYFVSL